MWWGDFWTMPWMVFGPLMMIVFGVLCAAGIFLMMRGSNGGRALGILEERYARGEINRDEFEERRHLLER